VMAAVGATVGKLAIEIPLRVLTHFRPAIHVATYCMAKGSGNA
jgi:hypothetical protein